MKIKRSVLIGSIVVAISILVATIYFLNTLNDSVCALVDALKNDNGILRVTSARQYSNVITAFVDAIRESEN